MQQIKTTLFLYAILIGFSIPICYGQYKISGYIEAEQQNKTVYLSLLKYDEETMITENQILFSTQTDSSGYFEFKGQLLSEKDKLYRIHSNINSGKGLQLIQDNEKSNYHNFIFSNRDTIYFSKSGSNWFSQSKNSNLTDKKWEKLKSFEGQLEKSNSQIKNKEAQQQAINDFAEKVKSYSEKNMKHPLLKLLAFWDIKKSDFDVKTDFEKNLEFYEAISNSLKNYYGETSYYLQYQDEISKISNVILQQQYAFHKKLNYFLGFLVFVLNIVAVFQFRKLKLLKPKENQLQFSNLSLTSQEEKITRLILADKTNKEIANALFISLSTVKTHIRNLYAKLDVANRHELAEKLKNHPRD
ncbi:response regulator transcription factor [Flavobacterium sp. DG2-3]|uniref:response regulator transcription factor n=1 Tax=Flavobacterium sp. DG2-3 TaxID=3068317 RepID=UPI00273FEA7E|nr:response regulator transcription factor [Flavobacterium sp. DG2-3]MDP5199848.1 response regulator transcription factor [Flavobacterium sp. DG2-3]